MSEMKIKEGKKNEYCKLGVRRICWRSLEERIGSGKVIKVG